MATGFTESTTPTHLTEHEAGFDTRHDTLRVDHVIDSRHKYVSATPHFVTVDHAGKSHQLALPRDCPACDFLVTSAIGDFLFLIGSQRPGRGGETYRGAVVVARKRKDGVYATELWHETHLSFVMRVSRDKDF